MARVIFMMTTIRNLLIIMYNKKTEADYRSNSWTLDNPSGYLGRQALMDI
jgi:hypothetical protein